MYNTNDNNIWNHAAVKYINNYLISFNYIKLYYTSLEKLYNINWISSTCYISNQIYSKRRYAK